MNLYFTLIIIILTIVCFILFTKYKLEKERYKNLKLSNENLDKLEIYNQNLKEELLKVKEQNILEKEDAFNRGFENGKRINSYEVQIHPYQDIFINKKTFSTEEVIKIGYKYILFINGLPFPNSHIEIIETISRKEISEERISEILNKISELTNLIPNANIQLIGSLSEFGKKLLNQKKINQRTAENIIQIDKKPSNKNTIPTGLTNRCVYFLPTFRSYGTKKSEYNYCKMRLGMKYG